MSILIMLGTRSRAAIFDCCQPHKSFLIHVNSKWVNRHQGNVDSEIKFVAIQKQRVIDILTYYTRLFEIINFLEIVCDEYSFALAA